MPRFVQHLRYGQRWVKLQAPQFWTLKCSWHMDIHLPNYSIDMYLLVLYHKFGSSLFRGEWAMADVLTHVAAFLPGDRRQLWADLSLTQFTFPYCPIIFHQGIWPRNKILIPQFDSCILVIGLTKPIHNPCIPKLEKELHMFNWKAEKLEAMQHIFPSQHMTIISCGLPQLLPQLKVGF